MMSRPVQSATVRADVQSDELRSVYLVRHAFAGHADAARWPDDAKRPLTTDGIRRFRAAAAGLHVIAPDAARVLSSGYARAWQTAELLREVAKWPEPEECSALEAGQPVRGALDALRDCAGESVALVGHEPFLSRLASLLCAGHEDTLRLKLKKGGVVLIRIEAGIRPDGGCLMWSVTPKHLRAVAE